MTDNISYTVNIDIKYISPEVFMLLTGWRLYSILGEPEYNKARMSLWDIRAAYNWVRSGNFHTITPPEMYDAMVLYQNIQNGEELPSWIKRDGADFLSDEVIDFDSFSSYLLMYGYPDEQEYYLYDVIVGYLAPQPMWRARIEAIKKKEHND